ncbi:MAG: hypothetical protein N2578_04470 [Bdellovibrionaceae bacterium]|nr:hypothetical protein [Pseudobdellovibrionaceae bacterium]
MPTRHKFVSVTSSFLLLISLLIALFPQSRDYVRNLLHPQQRVLLAKATGFLAGDGPYLQAFKIAEGGNILLEVYKSENADSPFTLLGTLTLENQKDGFFHFQGNATNFVLADIDNDGFLEIVSPTYDGVGNPRVTVFKYNLATGLFDRVSGM